MHIWLMKMDDEQNKEEQIETANKKCWQTSSIGSTVSQSFCCQKSTTTNRNINKHFGMGQMGGGGKQTK